MKIQEILTEMYTAYVLDEQSRDLLLKKFPPKYSKVIAHHVTAEFGVPADTPPPPNAIIKVYGYADSGDGLETLVVAVNGEKQREDGKYYHITWSLDPDKYKPVDSGDLIRYGKYKIVLPISIATVPQTLK